MNTRLALLLLMALSLSACATAPRTPVDTSDSEMLGLGEGPTRPIWEDWTPTPAQSMPAEQLESVKAFDYWQIDDPEYIESAWAALSTLLDSVRRHTQSDPMRQGVTLMLEALEPDADSPLIVDTTFYVADDREGVAVRFSRVFDGGGSASVVAFLGRRADGTTAPDMVRVFATPGFEEPSGFVVALRRGEEGWRSTLAESGGSSDVSDGVVREAELYADVLASQLWEPITGTAYAGGHLRAESPGPIPDPFRPALGLEVGDRQIEQVFTNSVFTPRMDDFAPDI